MATTGMLDSLFKTITFFLIKKSLSATLQQTQTFDTKEERVYCEVSLKYGKKQKDHKAISLLKSDQTQVFFSV